MGKIPVFLVSGALSAVSAACASVPEKSCTTETILASAEVTTSYGSTYAVETWYRSPDEAAARFVRGDLLEIIVEGPYTWLRQDGEEERGSDPQRRFAIGHQFHALALHFDQIMTDIGPQASGVFDGRSARARSGRFPTGGVVTLYQDAEGKPAGLLLELPDEPGMSIHYSDWREGPAGNPVPYSVTIEQEGNRFDYHYIDIVFTKADRADFERRYPAPDIPEIRDYRANLAPCP